ncbi:MAG: hypothetical protein HY927_11540 [Elusimicrobia bacterium]|nr:hypothetical protein [Elusimicrobiota bacterium]
MSLPRLGFTGLERRYWRSTLMCWLLVAFGSARTLRGEGIDLYFPVLSWLLWQVGIGLLLAFGSIALGRRPIHPFGRNLLGTAAALGALIIVGAGTLFFLGLFAAKGESLAGYARAFHWANLVATGLAGIWMWRAWPRESQ